MLEGSRDGNRKIPRRLTTSVMVYRAYIPHPPLSGFVHKLWSDEGYDPPHAKERALPTGTIELIINLLDDEMRVYDRQNHAEPQRFRGALICGAHSGYFVIDTAQQSAVMGVHFRPGGAFPFLGVPARELRDAHVSLDALWGPDAVWLRERLLEAATPEARFRILEQALLARIEKKSPAPHPAVSFALGEFLSVPHARRISKVTDRTGLSQRRFIQVFNEEVGLTPKLFCRVRRFQEIVRHLESRERNVEWAEVALASGYYDQAHFIRDFQAFCGLTPTAYLTQRGERLNHVPLGD